MVPLSWHNGTTQSISRIAVPGKRITSRWVGVYALKLLGHALKEWERSAWQESHL